MDSRLYDYILLRDGGCVARFVNNTFWASRWPMLQGITDPGLCRTHDGTVIDPTTLWLIEEDHVKDELGMAIREDDPEQLWSMCPYHHRGKTTTPGWATLSRVREAARAYIAEANRQARKAGWPPYPWTEVSA